MSADKLLRADELQNSETFKIKTMKHIVIFKHTSVVIRTDEYFTIEHNYEFTDFRTALDLYQEKVKEYSEHVGTICASKLDTSLKLVSKDDDGETRCHYRINMSN